MKRQTSRRKRTKGTILLIIMIAICIGTFVASTIIKFSTFSNKMTEREIGNMKNAQAAKLANSLYLTAIENTTSITDEEIQALQARIGGVGSTQQTIFGYQNSSTPSLIPGFCQLTVNFKDYNYVQGTVLLPPDDGVGFNYFNDKLTQTIRSVYHDPNSNDVETFQDNTMATFKEVDDLHIVPVFNMLAFYDRDLEFFAEEMGGFFLGRAHTNGNLFLTNLNKMSGTEMEFHSVYGSSILSAHGKVFRRGRGGLSSTFWPHDGNTGAATNQDAQEGIEFYSYPKDDYDDLLESDFNINQPNPANEQSNTRRILRPDYLTHEDPANAGSIQDSGYSTTDIDGKMRRHAGNNADFGCRFQVTSHAASEPSFSIPDANNDYYGIINADSDSLSPPVVIQPYQYIEDNQLFDTPDTNNYAAPIPSNYTEDASAEDQLAAYAYNSIAPLVIRDGVAYQRSTPGGSLTKVVGSFAYPDATHANAKIYSDLRWYGHFGQDDGVSASPENPDRWHFPIKSVTINATQDANNAGDGATSTEGTAVPFKFRGSTILDPTIDGVSSGTAPWIRRDIDLHGLSGYPLAGSFAAGDAEGNGVGMFNSTYPTFRNGIERYDPVRVAYNLVKAEVRKLYNSSHIYTSRHNGIRMLNADGSTPTADNAPDVWGTAADKMQDAHGVDYDNSDDDYNPSTDLNYSAFWNDDGGIGLPPITNRFRYIRIVTDSSISSPGTVVSNLYEWNFKEGADNYPLPAWPTFDHTNLGVLTVTEQNDPKVLFSTQNNNVTNTVKQSYDNDDGTFWKPKPADKVAWVIMDMGLGKDIGPTWFSLYCTNNLNAPFDMIIEGTNDNTVLTDPLSGAIAWTHIKSMFGMTWNPVKNRTFQLAPESGTKYVYRRDPDHTTDTVLNTTFALEGELSLVDNDDTPAVELFPIRHNSLSDRSVVPGGMGDWFIYKSTLPLSNRTLAMPASRDNLIGWNLDAFVFSNSGDLDDLKPLEDASGNGIRNTNLGHAGLSKSDDSFHNWLTLLNNAPEMLVRQRAVSHEVPDYTSATSYNGGLSYYAGDAGGYYGNDNLCMIDSQEKKIVVFTELDIAEFTSECFTFNSILTDFTTNNATIRDLDQLQNIIYIVNTTMGQDFYGKRVHCGAVRLKRGRLLPFPLSIASPNAVYVWGDYNCPGYWHHGPQQPSAAIGNIVDYTVPVTREHDTTTVIPSQPAAIYADAVQIIENNWIPFDQTDSAKDQITDTNMGSLISSTVDHNLGYLNAQLSASSIWPSNPGGHDFQNDGANPHSFLDFTQGTIWDHSLWWEDDGLRICGGAPNTDGTGASSFNNGTANIYLDSKPASGFTASTSLSATNANRRSRGSQLFMNYHPLHFSIPATTYTQLTLNILQRYEGGGIPIMKIMPQCIVGGFFYGNVEGRSPSVFLKTEVSAIPVTRPTSVMELDWLTSWIPRINWHELERDDLMDLDPDCAIGNANIDVATEVGVLYYGTNLTTGNYYGFNANAYVEDRFEILKKRFGNIGFKLDIRSMHTYHFPILPIWANDASGTPRQNYNRSFIGAFACLYDSRQTTHEQREKDNSWEGRSMYAFNPEFENQDGLPPGTPLTTDLGASTRAVGGTKWEY